MDDTKGTTASNWHIIESGDRWYQAVLRFTPSVAAQAQGFLIRRWDLAAATELIGCVGQDHARRVVLLWEIPTEPKAFLWTLEVIATIHGRAVQLAHVPVRNLATRALVVQEAGVAFLLQDLWTLESVIHRLTDRPANSGFSSPVRSG